MTIVGSEVRGHVGVVELRDPPHNFLSVDQVSQVADALEAFDRDGSVRAAVLCAQGKSFCGGASFGGGGSGPQGADLYAQGARLMEVEVPFVAAVHGAVIGGGLGFALTASLRVTCRQARWSANFVKLGLHQGFGMSLTVPALCGPSKAALVLLTGRRFDGQEATDLGLADLCVEQDDVRDVAFEIAEEIASGAPLAIGSINRTLRRDLAARFREATGHEAAEQAKLFSTSDFREGVKSYAERRPGNFTGE